MTSSISLHEKEVGFFKETQWLDRLLRLRLSFLDGGDPDDVVEVVVKETAVFSLSTFTAKPGDVFPTHFQD